MAMTVNQSLSATMLLDAYPAFPMKQQSSSSIVSRNHLKRGLSVADLADDSDEDCEHVHICKRVSLELQSARNLLIPKQEAIPSSGSNEVRDTRAHDLFLSFIKDMPLPDESESPLGDDTISSFDGFASLSDFLAGPTTRREFSESSTVSDSSSDEDFYQEDFWQAIYVMHQEASGKA